MFVARAWAKPRAPLPPRDEISPTAYSKEKARSGLAPYAMVAEALLFLVDDSWLRVEACAVMVDFWPSVPGAG
ncbi:hypothetical protein NKG94_33965 [Micromonospora sp. M12]